MDNNETLLGVGQFIIGFGVGFLVMMLHKWIWNFDFQGWWYTKTCKERFSLCLDCALHNRCRRYRKHLVNEINPYVEGSPEHRCWMRGWDYVHKALEQEKADKARKGDTHDSSKQENG